MQQWVLEIIGVVAVPAVKAIFDTRKKNEVNSPSSLPPIIINNYVMGHERNHDGSNDPPRSR